MNEIERLTGLMDRRHIDPDSQKLHAATKAKLFELNHTPPSEVTKRNALIRGLLGKIGQNFVIEGPLHCEYGLNTEIGDNFYANVNLVILDIEPVKIGNDVWIGEGVCILPGVTIGSKSIITAKTLVQSDVPPGVVFSGTPGQVIRMSTKADRLSFP